MWRHAVAGVLSVVVSAGAWAQDTVAVLRSMTGDVIVVRNGQTQPTRAGMTLHDQDQLVTGSTGSAALQLNDGSVMTVGSHIHLVITPELARGERKRDPGLRLWIQTALRGLQGGHGSHQPGVAAVAPPHHRGGG